MTVKSLYPSLGWILLTQQNYILLTEIQNLLYKLTMTVLVRLGSLSYLPEYCSIHVHLNQRLILLPILLLEISISILPFAFS